MRYLALAVDYDGTAATHGNFSEDVTRAIERLRASGRRSILLTGQRLADLPGMTLSLFDLVVAENGAVVFDPHRHEKLLLANGVPSGFVDRLRERGIRPVDVGEVVGSTSAEHRGAVVDTICELGLELTMIFNRTALLVLPAGVNKATGLEFALRRLALSRHEAVAIGDAENDHSFLLLCECGAAVGNAVPGLKDAADLVTHGADGAGVAELVDELIRDDLRRMEGKINRHLLLVGARADGTDVHIPPYGRNVLIAGPSGSGKSTLTAALVERLIDKEYQLCVVDPEGDYGTLQTVSALGNPQRTPSVNEILAILEDAAVSISVNLLGLPLADRPAFFAQLIPGLIAMRARTGRPHWIVLDEAHHMLPQAWQLAPMTLPQELGETILVTVHPEHVTPAVLSPVDVVFAVGHSPESTLRSYAEATGRPLVWPRSLAYETGKVVAWFTGGNAPPFSMQPTRGRAERIRHLRKYAEGNMRYRSFFFRGPDNRHNLRAHNLALFCQIAEGIDEPTWLFHLRQRDYSQWFRHAVKDSYLADEMERIEQRTDLAPQQTRDLVRELVGARYTLPE
jgi:hydroxymethylpyrimidine pyrophosphatase-like HAD family hydrolase